MKISFSGVYDIRFPQGTREDIIDSNIQKAKEFVKKYDALQKTVDITKMDSFSSTRSILPLEQKGIRVSTTVDNPWFLCSLFDSMDKKLGQEYVNKAKVELIFDTQA